MEALLLPILGKMYRKNYEQKGYCIYYIPCSLGKYYCYAVRVYLYTRSFNDPVDTPANDECLQPFKGCVRVTWTRLPASTLCNSEYEIVTENNIKYEIEKVALKYPFSNYIDTISQGSQASVIHEVLTAQFQMYLGDE